MQIVLPGGLADAAIAPTLVPHIEEKAPQLAGWLARAQARVIPAAVADTLCTPLEYWALCEHGFTPTSGQAHSAGLAALHAHSTGAETSPAQALWLGQLVHVAPARDGAALIPAGELEITPAESVALFESAAEYFEGTGFSVSRFDTAHWRIEPPAGYTPQCASPALVSITSVNAWWTQDTAGRPWRRLVNELQMLWFDHPVNRERESRGLRPINSVWLYGGAAPQQLDAHRSGAIPEDHVIRALQGPALVQDWGSWLLALERLDKDVFAELPIDARVVLTGTDRIVELTPARRGMIDRLLNRKQDWRKWWSAKL